MALYQGDKLLATGVKATTAYEHAIKGGFEGTEEEFNLLLVDATSGIDVLTRRLNALANSDDVTLDQMAEVAEYIKNNRDLIQAIMEDKVNVADVVNDLTTGGTTKPLSAEQGVILKESIPTKISDLSNDAGYLTSYVESDPTVPDWAKQAKKPSYTAEEVGAVSVDQSINNEGAFLCVVDGKVTCVKLTNLAEEGA